MHISPTGRSIALGGWDGLHYVLWLQDRRSGERRSIVMGQEPLRALRLLPGGDKALVASGQSLWAMELSSGTKQRIGVTSGEFRALEVARRGAWAVTGDDRGHVRFWDHADLVTREEPLDREGLVGVRFLVGSRTGRFFSLDEDHRIRLWGALSGEDKVDWPVGDSEREVLVVPEHGRWAAWPALGGRRLTVWSTAKAKARVKELRLSTKKITALATDPSGGILLSGDEDGWVRLWSVEDQGEDLRFASRAELHVPCGAIEGLAVDAKGSRMAIVCAQQTSVVRIGTEGLGRLLPLGGGKEFPPAYLFCRGCPACGKLRASTAGMGHGPCGISARSGAARARHYGICGRCAWTNAGFGRTRRHALFVGSAGKQSGVEHPIAYSGACLSNGADFPGGRTRWSWAPVRDPSFA